MADKPYQIQQVIEETPFDGVKPITMFRVSFMVGADGPFYERFPKGGFSILDADLKLSAFARDLATLRA